ncbi:hypothetical protein [Umezakia ovalisporum]|uniref:hypothetical protein n=1 Tax=Umezakia ovalisporum TaxID=75695 RepID=UPI0039C6CA1F
MDGGTAGDSSAGGRVLPEQSEGRGEGTSRLADLAPWHGLALSQTPAEGAER